MIRAYVYTTVGTKKELYDMYTNFVVSLVVIVLACLRQMLKILVYKCRQTVRISKSYSIRVLSIVYVSYVKLRHRCYIWENVLRA